MATISVLSYGNPSITQTLANSNVTKMSIVNRTKCSPALQLKSNIGNNNTNINNNNPEKTNLNVKPNNKRPYNVMNAKKSKAFPLSETKSNVINVNPTALQVPINSAAAQRSAKLAKTLKRPLPEIDTTVLCRANGGKTKTFPLPLAVARRNARERNRVKQVNNGFAALRDRIPEEISEAFEAQGNGRGSIKKLSKVETLRMAVEYIRSLERVLGVSPDDSFDPTGSSSNDIHSCNDSYQLSDTSSISALTPPHSDNISSGSFDDSDGLPDVTIIEGHQYIRIPGTNTYQLLETTIVNDSAIIYENDENIEPIIMTQVHNHHQLQQQQQQQHIMLQQHSQPSPPIDEYTADMANDSINCYNDVYNNHILTPASISPGAYSMQSSTALSPALHEVNPTQISTSHTINERSFLTTAQRSFIQTQLKTEISSSISALPLNDSALYTESLVGQLPINPQYEGILTLQTKFKDEIEPLTEENMLEAMNWWNSQHSTEPMTHDS